MAAGNYLFRFGNYVFPMTCIAEDGYDCKPNQRQDLDPYTDQTGLTHRNTVPHTKSEVTITTRSNLTWDEMTAILAGLRNNYSSYKQRDAQCLYYDIENDTMKTGHFYLQSSQDFGIRQFKKRFKAATFVFVEY